MNAFVLVAAGGAVGSMARHLVNMATLRWLGPTFPWGTMAVNITGSLAMGLFIGWLSQAPGASASLRLFLATGILGGFTTFSAFSLDVAVLVERGTILSAVAYAATSIVLSLLAIFLGLWLARTAA